MQHYPEIINYSQSRLKQKGFSLIEIMVSILVIAIGLLGVAGLQTVSLRQNYGSNLLAQATFQSQNIIERMRANMLGVSVGDYDYISGYEVDPNCTANCTSAQLAAHDAASWASTTKSALNDAGTGNVTSTVLKNADNTFTVSISWKETALPGQVDTNGNKVSLVTNQHIIRFIP